MSDHEKFVFDISPFHFFELFLKQLQLQSTQTTIFEQFLEARAMDANSSNNSNSSYCFLFELCAREAASLGAIGHGDGDSFSIRAPIFLKRFSERFLSEMVPNGASDGLTNVATSDKKQHLKRSPQNLLNMC